MTNQCSAPHISPFCIINSSPQYTSVSTYSPTSLFLLPFLLASCKRYWLRRCGWFSQVSPETWWGVPSVIIRCPFLCFLKSHSEGNRERRSWVMGTEYSANEMGFPGSDSTRWISLYCGGQRRKKLIKTGFSNARKLLTHLPEKSTGGLGSRFV